jgi:RNA polymerase sigma factor (sigma-70 family)
LPAEKQLWLRIADGDQEAYAEVYRFYYKRFYNYGRKFTDDEFLVEDAVQETLLTIWDKRHTLSSINYAGTYFYTSFRYTILAKLKLQRRLAAETRAEEDPEFAADQIIIAKETEAGLKEQLEKALAHLTARQREAIFLRFYEGLSYEEVASVLDITTKATYKIMARALLQLKENFILSSGLLLLLLQHDLKSNNPF